MAYVCCSHSQLTAPLAAPKAKKGAAAPKAATEDDAGPAPMALDDPDAY